MWSKRFVLDALERAVKSAAQGALAVFGTDWAGIDVVKANVAHALQMAAAMAVLSVLTSVASVKANGISPASVVPPGA